MKSESQKNKKKDSFILGPDLKDCGKFTLNIADTILICTVRSTLAWQFIRKQLTVCHKAFCITLSCLETVWNFNRDMGLRSNLCNCRFLTTLWLLKASSSPTMTSFSSSSPSCLSELNGLLFNTKIFRVVFWVTWISRSQFPVTNL